MFFQVDEFLDNPDKVLHLFDTEIFYPCSFYNKATIYSGIRAVSNYSDLNNEIKFKLETILKFKICKLEICFNIVSESSGCGFPHKDASYPNANNFAGVIYLNKNAPENTGTTLFDSIDIDQVEDLRSKMEIAYCFQIPKNNRIKKKIIEEIKEIKQKAKVMKKIDNVFNRMIVYDSFITHSPDNYYGNNRITARKTIAFFGSGET